MGARFLGVRCSPAACSLERSRAECVEFGAEALEKRALSELRTRSKAAALRGMESCFGAWSRASERGAVLRGMDSRRPSLRLGTAGRRTLETRSAAGG